MFRRLPKVLIPLLAWSGVVIALAGVLSGPQAALAFATLTGAGGMGLVWVLLGRKVPVAVAQHG